jgi:hypothetical protein
MVNYLAYYLHLQVNPLNHLNRPQNPQTLRYIAVNRHLLHQQKL